MRCSMRRKRLIARRCWSGSRSRSGRSLSGGSWSPACSRWRSPWLSLPDGHWDDVADEDWSLSWKQHWQADPVGTGLLILPAWLEVLPEHADRLVIKMDPGSAFGTGSHPTTRLCLEALEQSPPQGALVADLGCGSGCWASLRWVWGRSRWWPLTPIPWRCVPQRTTAASTTDRRLSFRWLSVLWRP